MSVHSNAFRISFENAKVVIMSLHKTKHVTYKGNLNKKFIKVELGFISKATCTIYSYTWWNLTNEDNIPVWQRHRQREIPFALTGGIRVRLKSIRRGRPHIFQQYKAPVTGRFDDVST